MPFYSKMMSSYPMQLIRGLSPNVRSAAGRVGLSAAVGGAVGYGMDRRRGGFTRGAVGGALTAGALAGASMYGPGLGQLGRNMMRPGIAGMMGRSAMGGAATFMRSAAGRLRGMI